MGRAYFAGGEGGGAMSHIFMCLVENAHRPKKRHATIELAMAEAQRLSDMDEVTGRVFVLADVAVIEKRKIPPTEPTITIKKKRLPILPE